MPIVNPIEVKAYDVTGLVAELKVLGLDLTEDAAKAVIAKVFVWAKASIVESETKLDDFILPFLPTAEAYIEKEVDKIDGKVG